MTRVIPRRPGKRSRGASGPGAGVLEAPVVRVGWGTRGGESGPGGEWSRAAGLGVCGGRGGARSAGLGRAWGFGSGLGSGVTALQLQRVLCLGAGQRSVRWAAGSWARKTPSAISSDATSLEPRSLEMGAPRAR